MLRRTGFSRKTYTPAPAAPLRRVERAGVLANCSAMSAAAPKPEAHRNAHLLSMARGRPCLFLAVDGCRNLRHDYSTTVACHENEGKGMGRKQNDEKSAWGCVECHRWYDQSGAPRAEKRRAFQAAHLAQVCEWRAIAGSAAAPIKDRLAAQWALDHLNASPTGELP